MNNHFEEDNSPIASLTHQSFTVPFHGLEFCWSSGFAGSPW